MFQFNNTKKGFTLIELLLTIFIVTIGLAAVFLIAQFPLHQTSISISRLTAAYLAQEGIEIVRNIRDTNWLEPSPWNSGLSPGNYEADYTYSDLVSCSGSCGYDDLRKLKIDNGFYKYSSGGEETKFKRKIAIESETDLESGTDHLKIKVTVYWKEKDGKTYTFPAVQENLYNWWSE